MKIAHISDLHLCSNYKKQNAIKTKRLIQHALDNSADHIIITGDISDKANEKDFLILRKILKTYNILEWDKTSLVIGNHDIFGGVQTAQDIINFPAKCIKTNYDIKVQTFFKYFEELFINTISISDENPFPFAKIINNIALIGMNSIDVYSKIKNPLASNGLVDKIQRLRLIKLLSKEELKGKIKIGMIHHHFYKNNVPSKSSENGLWNRIENFTMKLRGKKKLLKIFNDHNLKLVLHGHSHEVKDYERKGIIFLNAGGSIDNEKKTLSMYFLNINSDEIEVELHELEENLKPTFEIIPENVFAASIAR